MHLSGKLLEEFGHWGIHVLPIRVRVNRGPRVYTSKVMSRGGASPPTGIAKPDIHVNSSLFIADSRHWPPRNVEVVSRQYSELAGYILRAATMNAYVAGVEQALQQLKMAQVLLKVAGVAVLLLLASKAGQGEPLASLKALTLVIGAAVTFWLSSWLHGAESKFIFSEYEHGKR